MHILILSNLYPPHVIGGYEMACAKAAQGLAGRGHRISVLTSTYGAGKAGSEGDVHRRLGCDLDAGLEGAGKLAKARAYVKREFANQRLVREALREIRPDLVFVWNPRYLPMSCLALIEGTGIPVAYYIFDHWMQDIANDPWNKLARLLKRLPAGRLALGAAKTAFGALGLKGFDAKLAFGHVQFSTRYLRTEAHRAGIRPVQEEIVYWGVAPRSSPPPAKTPAGNLLYVGQLVPHKGIHRALEALRILLGQGLRVTLTLVGSSADRAYQDELKAMAKRFDMEGSIRWRGQRSESELESIYAGHDILLFPSIWDEPFGITQLEAMKHGLAVVTSGTGGAGEIVSHGVNGLTYDRDDPAGCAECVRSLLADPALFARLTREAQRTVAEKFVFEKTLDRMDAALRSLAESDSRGARNLSMEAKR